MRAYCLSCEVPQETSELAQAAWYGLDMLGCEEESLGKDKIRLKCYFKDSRALHSAEFSLMDICPSVPLSISIIADQDWNATWKKNMKPVQVAPGIWVSPAWLKPDLKPKDKWIQIEPKMAFGTGHHETTRLASQGILFLEQLLPKGFKMLDIGTGSGILCFVSNCVKASLAIGVDLDPVCLSNLAENKRKNKTKASVHFGIGSIDMFTVKDFFDCVVMNMISKEALPLLDAVLNTLKTKGKFIWSGLLVEEKEIIIKLALEHGFLLLHDSYENEWWCGIFEKI